MTEPKVEVLPIEKAATPDLNNVNRHTARGGALVVNSLQRRGAFRSIASAGKDADTPVVYAGNLTLEKAVEAGFTEVVNVHVTGHQLVNVVRDDVAPGSPEAIALGLEDNESGKQSYNPDIDLLAQLAAGDDAILGALRKEDKVFGGMLEGMGLKDEPQDAEPQIDRAAELLEKWQVKTGDLWRIGEHRLLCGDCIMQRDVYKLMQGEKVGAVITDPPYGINREGIENDDPEGLERLFNGCLSLIPIDNAVIIAFQSPRLFPVWLDSIRKANYKFERILWLYKSNDVVNPWHGWMMNGEAIIVSSFGKPEWGAAKSVQDTYNAPHEISEKIPHKSIKPLWVVQDLVEHTAGDVYDPFTGSGTTLVACQNLGRKCRAIEISPAYCSVILQRMSDAFPGIEIERLVNAS